MNVQLKCLFLFLLLYPFHLCHSWKNNNPLFWIYGGSRRMSNNTTNHKMSSSKEEKEVVSSHISTTGGDDESERVYQLLWEEAKLDMKDTKNNKTKKRMDYLSWDDYFMSIAFLSAQRSKDPDHQRGACIVNAEHQIVGIGYNGFPRGCHDDCLPWSDTSHSELHTKHPFLCPAEVNAILNKCSENVQGATLYVHQFPGNESAKVIIQAGIRQVVYMENTLEQDVSRKASRILFQMANVQTRQYTPTLTTIDLDFGSSHEPPSYNDKTTQHNVQEIQNKYRDLLLEEANYDPTSIHTGKREGYLSWDDYFMSVAFLSAKRSKDPSTQVGACIVNSDKNIIGIGYNGFPRGCSDDHLPWSRSSDCSSLHTKYPYVVHAEVNAILNKCSANVQGATLYVALFPCNDCAKVIIQAGITEVVYLSDKYHDTDQCRASRIMFQMAGVKLRQYFPQRKKITISFVSKS